jgi:hypothetical protein
MLIKRLLDGLMFRNKMYSAKFVKFYKCKNNAPTQNQVYHEDWHGSVPEISIGFKYLLKTFECSKQRFQFKSNINKVLPNP